MEINQERKTNPFKGLYGALLLRTLFPLILLGIILVFVGGYIYSRGISNKVKEELHGECLEILSFYDNLYPGGYSLLLDNEKEVKYLKKGGVIISDDSSVLDDIKRSTDIEASIFFYDCRMLTTLMDEKGNRYVGSTVNEATRETVLKNKQEKFYENLSLTGNRYYVNYMPIYGEDKTCIGMVATAKLSNDVYAGLYRVIINYTIIAIIMVILACVLLLNYINELTAAIRKIMKYLGEMAQGKLDTSVDEVVFSRKDELGEMARFTVRVQADLKKMIEKDPLTGLNNRRSCDNKFDTVMRKTNSFCLALGDIDFFKKVNDSFGHEAGDAVLVEVSRQLKESIAGHGFAVRWGGEEFLLIIEDMKIDEAAKLVQSALNNIKNTMISYNGLRIGVSMTMGIKEGDYEAGLDKNVSAVDKLLYYGKEHGRDQLVRPEDVK